MDWIGPATRAQNLIAGSLFVLFVSVGWMGRSAIEISSGDDLTYLALSHSLEQGSYREIYRASAPLHVQYPPAYPAWLVVVRHLTGERLWLIPAVSLLLVSGALLMIFTMTRVLLGGWLAVVVLLLLVANPAVLWTGGSYYSEALFLLLSTGSLYSAFRHERDEGRGWLIASMALALLSFLTRAAGTALIAGIAVWLLSRRRRAALAAFTAASLLVVGGWFAYTTHAQSTEPVRTYGSDFLTGGAAEHPNVARELALRVVNNARDYMSEILPVELAMPTVEGTLVDNLLWLLVNIVCLSAGIVVLWRRWRAMALYVIMTAGLLLLWPWAIDRLLAPLIPFLFTTLFVGAATLARQFVSPRVGNVALGVLTVLLVFGSARASSAHVAALSECDRAAPYTSAGCYSPETRALIAAAEYVRRTASPSDVVLAWRPSSVHFLSGRRGEFAGIVRRVPPGELADTLRARGIRYALLTGINEFERDEYARSLAAACADFRVEARFDPSALLLVTEATRDASIDSGADACTAVAGYRRANPAAPDE